METGKLREAYEALFTAATTGGFGPPPAGQWSAERVVAHLAANDQLLTQATKAVLADDPRVYYNHDAIDGVRLDALVAEHGDLSALVELVRTTSATLCALAERLDERRGGTPVHTHIQDGETVRVDQPLPWAAVLDAHAENHLPRHIEQLRALRHDAG